MNKKEILFIILDDFTDWESAFVAPFLNKWPNPERPAKYTVKTLSVTKNPVVSIGGFNVLPDYDIHTVPEDYSGIIIVGGMKLFTPEAELIIPLVEKAVKDGKLVAGICNGSVFLGKHGFLNNVKHTSNTLDYLKETAGSKYTGEANYIDQQAVRDKNIITANGTAEKEFCREILYALDVDTPEAIEEIYLFYKNGACPK